MRKFVAWTTTVIALTLCVAGPVMAVEPTPSITVGEIHLQPNTPGQVVELFVTGGTAVQGLSLNLLVANGGPEFEELDLLAPGEGILGPAITSVDIITDTIFANNNVGQINAVADFGLSQAAVLYTLTASGDVFAEGLLARITFDTTGFSEGSFPLSLSLQGDDTAFSNGFGEIIPTNHTDGTLVIDALPPPPDLPPVVDAGADLQVAGGASVELVGTASDPEDAPLTYLWQQTDGPPVVLSDATAATARFTAPAPAVNTALTFQLTVSDGINVQSDTVIVTVTADLPPVVDAGADLQVAGGASVELVGTASDPEDAPLTYLWQQTDGPPVVLSDATAATARFTAPAPAVNTALTFQLTVSDGINVQSDTVIVTVAADLPPVVDAGADLQVAGGASVELVGTASDPEDAPLTYLWQQTDGAPVVLSDATAATARFTAPAPAVNTALTFQLTVSDGVNVQSDTVVVTVAANVLSFSVDAGPDQTVANEAPVTLIGTVDSPNGQPLTLQWKQVNGPDVILNGAATVSAGFQAPAVVVNTVLTFQFEASDGATKAMDTVNVEVNPSPAAPVADAGADQAVDAGATVQLDGMATDPAGAGLTYAWVQTSGPTVSLGNAAVAGPTFVAPSLSTPSDLVFEFSATSREATSIDTVTIHVAAAQSSAPSFILTDGSSFGGDFGNGQDSGSAETEQSTQTDRDSTTEEASAAPLTLQSFLGGLAMVLLAIWLLFFLWL